ncbi:hypothetical protein TNCV_904781 [Trichonephila clavipes]|nr:hypothetical protein TNCV_904781 [Trichonephila clavipes]
MRRTTIFFCSCTFYVIEPSGLMQSLLLGRLVCNDLQKFIWDAENSLRAVGHMDTRCHLHEDQAQDALDRPTIEKTGTLQGMPPASSAAIQAHAEPSIGVPVSSQTPRKCLAEGHLGSQRALRGLQPSPTLKRNYNSLQKQASSVKIHRKAADYKFTLQQLKKYSLNFGEPWLFIACAPTFQRCLKKSDYIIDCDATDLYCNIHKHQRGRRVAKYGQ